MLTACPARFQQESPPSQPQFHSRDIHLAAPRADPTRRTVTPPAPRDVADKVRSPNRNRAFQTRPAGRTFLH
eukprot:8713791-Heterocapsa_arctica.AAC.1